MNGREKHATFQEVRVPIVTPYSKQQFSVRHVHGQAVLQEMKRGLDDPSCLDAEMVSYCTPHAPSCEQN